jgi:hypothetical protein
MEIAGELQMKQITAESSRGMCNVQQHVGFLWQRQATQMQIRSIDFPHLRRISS